MGDWPAGDAQRSFFQTAAVVTPSATANTFGSWFEISSALPFDVAFWDVHLYQQNLADGAVDFGLGGVGAESAFITLPIYQGGVNLESIFTVPLRLPAGQRLSGRAKFNMTSAADVFPDFHFYAGQSFLSPTPYQLATTYGLTNSSGVSVSSGATSNYGSWTEITPSTGTRIKQMIVVLQPFTSLGSGFDVLVQLDVGIGAGGSETVLFERLYFYYENARNLVPNASVPMPCDLPAGTRLSVRTVLPNDTGTVTVEASVIGVC